MKETVVEQKKIGQVVPAVPVSEPTNLPFLKGIAIVIEGPSRLRLVHRGMGSSFEIESALRWALEAVQAEIRGT